MGSLVFIVRAMSPQYNSGRHNMFIKAVIICILSII